MKTLKTSPKSVWINFSFVVKRMANGASIYCVLFGGLCHFTQDHSCIFLAVRFWSNLSFIANALLIGSPIFSFWCMIGHLQVAFQQVSISVYWPIPSHCFQFLLGITHVPTEINNNAKAILGGNKVYCRQCDSGELTLVFLWLWRF